MSADYRLAVPAAFGWLVTAIVVGVDPVAPAIGLWLAAGVVTALAFARRGLAIVALSCRGTWRWWM